MIDCKCFNARPRKQRPPLQTSAVIQREVGRLPWHRAAWTRSYQHHDDDDDDDDDDKGCEDGRMALLRISIALQIKSACRLVAMFFDM